ncbi:hypothetical protein BU24DRAFT_421140 [Aaosphaeria arxii CBS 175.79]|uniref:C2H2-type domain-containing protein n=1 Tax=Aaosphaeria arxii CBS 175.79 TaxID=1450172 RepID=A0A6A5XZI7_9PLEO|nr:uncharacterized protein BU24DRAFT_421140 [Aaosphaeria arxii CBS 175.79]KAF2018141.1 hypothetical protein BU24DRAFT_421140 [Aaosphaeria arxii CBS 175.79]
MSRGADQELLSVADAANHCSSSFQACFDLLAIDPQVSSLLEDQLSRFSLWASTLKVSVTGRASLDHALRETPRVKEVVMGLLSLLDDQLRDYHSMLLNLPQLASNERKVSYDTFTNKIADEISLLYRVMNTILRATKESQDLRVFASIKVMSEDEEKGLRTSFYHRVRDICHTGASEGLVSRLAETMVLRRKRILYHRMRHGNNKAINPQENDGNKVFDFVVARPPPPESRSAVLTAPTLQLDAYNKASAFSTISRPSTVGFDRHEALRFPCPPKTKVLRRFKRLEEQCRRQYMGMNELETSSFGTPETTKKLAADLEKLWCELNGGAPEIQCPYCFHALTRADIENESRWRTHVRDDLDAYVCLFEPCDKPLQLFSSSSEWLKHMQYHAQRWKCSHLSHGPLSFETQEDYELHVKRDHQRSLNSRQSRILAETNRHQPEALFVVCPICGAQRSTTDLLIDHVIGHLRSLALQSLPIHYDDEPQSIEKEQISFQQISESTAGRSTIDNAAFSIISNHLDATSRASGMAHEGYSTTAEEEPSMRSVCGVDGCDIMFSKSHTDDDKLLHYEDYHSYNKELLDSFLMSPGEIAIGHPLACGIDDCTATFTGSWKHGDRKAHIRNKHAPKPRIANSPMKYEVDGSTSIFSGADPKGNNLLHIQTQHPLAKEHSDKNATNDRVQDLQINDSPLVCGVAGCTTTFTKGYTRGSRARHIRSHHSIPEFICEAGCGKVYRRQDARLKHYRKCHPHLAQPAVTRRSSVRKMDTNEETARAKRLQIDFEDYEGENA